MLSKQIDEATSVEEVVRLEKIILELQQKSESWVIVNFMTYFISNTLNTQNNYINQYMQLGSNSNTDWLLQK